MERVLTAEERIRRAEEIVELRRSERGERKRESLYDRVDNTELLTRKSLINKLMKQILICLIIYGIFFTIKNENYVFSQDFLNKSKEILSYDVNFIELYNNAIAFLQEKYGTEYNNQSEEVIDGANEAEKEDDKRNSNTKNEETKDEDNEKDKGKDETKNESVSEMKQDANYIKEKYAVIRPVKGIVSSEFGTREDSNPIVTEEHKGIDIAADTGTKIVAAMDGVVDIATTSSSYGNYIEITNNNVKTKYAHCNKLYVKEGDKVKKRTRDR